MTLQRWKSSTFITTEPFCRIQHLKVVFSIILQIKEIAQINEIYTSALSTAFLLGNQRRRIKWKESILSRSHSNSGCYVHTIPCSLCAGTKIRPDKASATHENGDLGAISVTEQSCAVPISEVDRNTSDRFCFGEAGGGGGLRYTLVQCWRVFGP